MDWLFGVLFVCFVDPEGRNRDDRKLNAMLARFNRYDFLSFEIKESSFIADTGEIKESSFIAGVTGVTKRHQQNNTMDRDLHDDPLSIMHNDTPVIKESLIHEPVIIDNGESLEIKSEYTFTDQQILDYEKTLKEDAPFVSNLIPLLALVPEYENAVDALKAKARVTLT